MNVLAVASGRGVSSSLQNLLQNILGNWSIRIIPYGSSFPNEKPQCFRRNGRSRSPARVVFRGGSLLEDRLRRANRTAVAAPYAPISPNHLNPFLDEIEDITRADRHALSALGTFFSENFWGCSSAFHNENSVWAGMRLSKRGVPVKEEGQQAGKGAKGANGANGENSLTT